MRKEEPPLFLYTTITGKLYVIVALLTKPNFGRVTNAAIVTARLPVKTTHELLTTKVL